MSRDEIGLVDECEDGDETERGVSRTTEDVDDAYDECDIQGGANEDSGDSEYAEDEQDEQDEQDKQDEEDEEDDEDGEYRADGSAASKAGKMKPSPCKSARSSGTGVGPAIRIKAPRVPSQIDRSEYGTANKFNVGSTHARMVPTTLSTRPTHLTIAPHAHTMMRTQAELEALIDRRMPKDAQEKLESHAESLPAVTKEPWFKRLRDAVRTGRSAYVALIWPKFERCLERYPKDPSAALALHQLECLYPGGLLTDHVLFTYLNRVASSGYWTKIVDPIAVAENMKDPTMYRDALTKAFRISSKNQDMARQVLIPFHDKAAKHWVMVILRPNKQGMTCDAYVFDPLYRWSGSVVKAFAAVQILWQATIQDLDSLVYQWDDRLVLKMRDFRRGGFFQASDNGFDCGVHILQVADSQMQAIDAICFEPPARRIRIVDLRAFDADSRPTRERILATLTSAKEDVWPVCGAISIEPDERRWSAVWAAMCRIRCSLAEFIKGGCRYTPSPRMDADGLADHCKDHENHSATLKELGFPTCLECDTGFPDDIVLGHHIQEQHPVGRIRCPVPAIFPTVECGAVLHKRKMDRHMRYARKSKLFELSDHVCEPCSAGFMDADILKTHAVACRRYVETLGMEKKQQLPRKKHPVFNVNEVRDLDGLPGGCSGVVVVARLSSANEEPRWNVDALKAAGSLMSTLFGLGEPPIKVIAHVGIPTFVTPQILPMADENRIRLETGFEEAGGHGRTGKEAVARAAEFTYGVSAALELLAPNGPPLN